MAVGCVVACDGVNQAPTCHSTSDSLVLAANRTASSIADVPRVPGETATAHASTER